MNNQTVTRIAVVDDHPIVLEGIEAYFQKSDVLRYIPKEVRTFPIKSFALDRRELTTLEGLLAELNSFHPDVLAIDFGLSPDFDGVHVAQGVKAANPNSKVIIYTGYNVLDGDISDSFDDSNLNVPDNIALRLVRAQDAHIVDKILQKSSKGLDKLVRNIISKLDYPLVPGIIGRGDFAIRIIQDLKRKFKPILNFGVSMAGDELLSLFELKKGNPYLNPVDSLQDLSDADFYIDCSSRLRGYQVPRVIKYETKMSGIFYPDRRVVFPYEKEHINILGPKLRKDKPLIPFSNSITYYMWMMFEEFNHAPELLYSPLVPDSSRLKPLVDAAFCDPKYAEFRNKFLRLLTNSHGDARAIIPERFGFNEEEKDRLTDCENEAIRTAYESQEVASNHKKAVFVPQIDIVKFFMQLYHRRIPHPNVTGYMKFQYNHEDHEGFISYPPLVDFRNLSIRPDWDTIDRLIGIELFMLTAAKYLDSQKNAYFEMKQSPSKVWYDTMAA